MRYLDSFEQLKSEKIYIYGAGMIARLLIKEIYGMKNLKIVACIISESTSKDDKMDGIPIINISQVKNNIEIPIIIATLSDCHIEISKQIEKYQCENYYAISERMFQEIREKHINKKNEYASQKLRINEMRKMASAQKIQGIVITDKKEEISKFLDNDVTIVSSVEFLQNKFVLGDNKNITVILIQWEKLWQKVIEKVFSYNVEVILSYRYKYIKIDSFSLIKFIKNKFYQLTATQRFFRDEKEYNTEDILLKFDKRTVFNMTQNKLCTSCGLCMLQCSQNAITMIKDEFGYEKPYCDFDKCISCNQCLEICPIYKVNYQEEQYPKCFTYMAEDEIRLTSSSGGFFSEAALEILNDYGYVCGAAWENDFSVKHIIIDSVDDLSKLKMSKYVRSNITQVLPKLKDALKKKKKVLFCGCPCQVAAVKIYLKNYLENLFTIDLICAETPSHWLIEQYLKENYDIDKIQEIGFRDKATGWRHDSFHVINKNGEKILKHIEDVCQKAFHSRLMMPIECEHCNFIVFPRVGDLTIGDAWGVTDYNPHFNDGKGTSTILINSQKGKYLYEKVSKKAKLSVETPIEWTFKNRTVDSVKPHPSRDRFYKEIEEFGFTKAVEDAYHYQYDIGLVGNWSYPNYGSELTYYALYNILKDMGYSILMIEWAEDCEWTPYGVTQLFEDEPYQNFEIAYSVRDHSEFEKYNKQCRMFVQGSDQLLHPYLYEVFGRNVTLDWVDSDKKKIGYALSFGDSNIKYEDSVRRTIAFHLDKFDAVSVREDSGVVLMKELFSVSAVQVLDPVFLCDFSKYMLIASKYINVSQGKKLFAYILDCIKDKNVLEKIATKLELNLQIVEDAARQNNKNISVEKWLAGIINSNFVITDSFHGMCFAIIFQKDFVAVCNQKRGTTRFLSLLKLLGLQHRLIWNLSELLNESLIFEKIDYKAVYKILNEKKEESIQWLKNALCKPHIVKYTDEYCALHEEFKRLEKMIKSRK